MSMRNTTVYSSDVGLSVCSTILNATMLTISMRIFFVMLSMSPLAMASVVALENLSGSLKVCSQVEVGVALLALMLGDYVKKCRTM